MSKEKKKPFSTSKFAIPSPDCNFPGVHWSMSAGESAAPDICLPPHPLGLCHTNNELKITYHKEPRLTCNAKRTHESGKFCIKKFSSFSLKLFLHSYFWSIPFSLNCKRLKFLNFVYFNILNTFFSTMGSSQNLILALIWFVHVRTSQVLTRLSCEKNKPNCIVSYSFSTISFLLWAGSASE